jgi:hypothetical protein
MADVADRGNLRLSDCSQSADLTGHIHAHLQNGRLMFRRQLQKHQGKTNEVIPIALGLQDIELSGKDAGSHLFRRGFPITSRYGHHLHGVAAAPGMGEVAEGLQNIPDQDGKFPWPMISSCALQPAALHQGASGSFGHGLLDEVMPVEPRSLQGDE